MKNIIAALGAVAVLVAAYLLLTDPQPNRSPEAGWAIPVLQAFDRIDLNRDLDEIVIEKVEAGWSIRRPIIFGAADSRMDRVVAIFADSENRLLWDNQKEASPNNLARYGFDEDDVFEVAIYEAGNEAARFAVGATEEAQSGATRTWVRPADSDTLYRMNRDLRAALDKDLGEWRDSEVLALERSDRDAIDAIDIEYDERTLRFERQTEDGEATWTLLEPTDVAIDPDLVSRWINQMSRLTAADFADDIAESDAGLDAPAHRTTLRFGDEREHVIEFGTVFAAADEGEDSGEQRRYVRLDSNPIFAVSTRDADRFIRRTGDFRPRDVLGLQSDDIVRIDLLDDDGRLILVRDELGQEAEEGDEPQWRMQLNAANDTSVRERRLEAVDMAELNRVLTNVSDIEADRFVDDISAEAAALDTPRRQITVTLADDTQHVIAVGGATEPAGDDQDLDRLDRYVRVDDGDLFELRSFRVRHLLKSADDLRLDDQQETDDEDG